MDDVLVILPNETNMDNKIRLFGNEDSDIQFMLVKEEDGKLPFLDTIIWRTDQEAKFFVYHRLTNNNDFIHHISAQDSKTESGVVISFFLKAFRISSEESLRRNSDTKLKHLKVCATRLDGK